MIAATRTPLTASGSAPGRTVLIARMAARSGRKSAALRLSAVLVTSSSTALSPGISVATKRPSPPAGGGRFQAPPLEDHSPGPLGAGGTAAALPPTLIPASARALAVPIRVRRAAGREGRD